MKILSGNTYKIFRIITMILMVLFVAFSLSACDSEEGSSSNDYTQDATTESETASKENQTCFQDSVMQTLYDAMGTSALGAYSDLTKGAMTISMLGFAFWFAWQMLTFVSSFNESSPAELWTNVTRQFFMCMVCGLLAASPQMVIWTLNTLVFPIFFSFLELGSEILNVAPGKSVAGGQCVAGEFLEYKTLSCKATLGQVTTTAFPSGPVTMMKCMICAINSRLSLGYKLAWIMRNSGGVVPWLMAVALIVIFWIIKMSFVFYLVDATFRMTMMIVLFPLLILAYAFQKTRKWANAGFLVIINVSAFMMFIGVVLAMILMAIEQIIIDNNNFYQDAEQKDADTMVVSLSMMLLGFLALSSMGIANGLASSLVGGGGDSDFAKKGAKVLAAGARKLANVITGGATAGLNAYIESHEKLKEMKEKIEKIKKKANKLAGRKTNG